MTRARAVISAVWVALARLKPGARTPPPIVVLVQSTVLEGHARADAVIARWRQLEERLSHR